MRRESLWRASLPVAGACTTGLGVALFDGDAVGGKEGPEGEELPPARSEQSKSQALPSADAMLCRVESSIQSSDPAKLAMFPGGTAPHS